ncbi:MAG TPA: hypothetical protein VIO16_04545 [Dehalococcoidia bacterium]
MSVASTLPSAWRACLYRSLLAAIGLLIVVMALGRPGAVYGRDLAADLQMRYIHQYLGNASDDHDCGPASIAMVLDAYNFAPRRDLGCALRREYPPHHGTPREHRHRIRRPGTRS